TPGGPDEHASGAARRDALRRARGGRRDRRAPVGRTRRDVDQRRWRAAADRRRALRAARRAQHPRAGRRPPRAPRTRHRPAPRSARAMSLFLVTVVKVVAIFGGLLGGAAVMTLAER